MTTTYNLYKDDKDGPIPAVEATTVDGVVWSVPFDVKNAMYQEYLAWVNEGNTASPPD